MTKTEFIQALASALNVSKAAASAFVETYAKTAVTALQTGGEATLPGLVKLTVKAKPAQPERQGINPFTKQPVTIKAKPASKKVKASPIAALKKAVV